MINKMNCININFADKVHKAIIYKLSNKIVKTEFCSKGHVDNLKVVPRENISGIWCYQNI